MTKYSTPYLMRSCLALLLGFSFLSQNVFAQAKKNIVEFNFLQINDVYEISPLENGKIGGMARVETLKETLKASNPNTYLFWREIL
jgi:5'-nucleotidase / UDP-sugar diphosphatase